MMTHAIVECIGHPPRVAAPRNFFEAMMRIGTPAAPDMDDRVTAIEYPDGIIQVWPRRTGTLLMVGQRQAGGQIKTLYRHPYAREWLEGIKS